MFALLAALDERDRTGDGMLVEATLAEAALNIAAEPVVEQSAYGRLLGRHGNPEPDGRPAGRVPLRRGPMARGGGPDRCPPRRLLRVLLGTTWMSAAPRVSGP